MKARIHLVRHGLSESNLDLQINRRKPDHAIELAEEGRRQARDAGNFLANYILKDVGGFHHRRVHMLVSPYKRTRQTADGIGDTLRRHGLDFGTTEELLLREQSFGLFDGIPDDELRISYPDHYRHYEKHTRAEGVFYAPMPMGESRAQVADRVRGAFGSILRGFSGQNTPPVTDLIVVSHGVTIRCFLTAWLHLPWEWCENEPNPWNCSITTIEGEEDKGWRARQIFAGFEQKNDTQQERREEGHILQDVPAE